MKEQLLKLVKTNRLSHAYYVECDNGEFAKWLATQILCYQPGTSNCDCSSCRRLKNDNHIDLFELYPDGLAIKVDQIREMNGKAALKSVDNHGQVFILHQADRLNVQASNALLKFLEEPHEKVTIILTGANQDKLLPTIRSRVQVLRVTADKNNVSATLLEQGIDFETLPICIAAGLNHDLIVKHVEDFNRWCELIQLTINEPNYADAIVWMKKWESEFSDKEKKQISLTLLQSYVKSLFEVKKGKITHWATAPIFDWETLANLLNETEALTQAIRSNGLYSLQCERFIRKIKAS